MGNIWDDRYAGEEYLFGTSPSDFLVTHCELLQRGQSCLAIADGEGRNGVWLAEQGLHVHSIDSSGVALGKAKLLAQERGVAINFEQADLLQWQWGDSLFDVVVGVFIQFAGQAQRAQLFQHMQYCLKPGGLLLLHGYSPKQLEYATGGPSQVENLYTEEILRHAFSDMEIMSVRSYDKFIDEGAGHRGMSALIDLIARKK